MTQKYVLKSDRYRKARGGRAALLDILCSHCSSLLLVYQKDGVGSLHRCYLNRIFDPPEIERLQHDPQISDPKHLPVLRCSHCQSDIGYPVRHQDGRLAFALGKGKFVRQVHRL